MSDAKVKAQLAPLIVEDCMEESAGAPVVVIK